MLKGIVGTLAAVVLLLSFSCFALSQEAKKEEMKKTETKVLKSASCDPTCGFMVRSHDEKEVAQIMIAHAKKAHSMKMTEKDVKAMMKTEEQPEMKKEEAPMKEGEKK